MASAISAFTWPVALLGSAGMIDNAWSMGVSRAQKAGLALADVLSKRIHGQRPLNLVGFSLGARLIFFALEALAAKGRSCEGIVAKVVLLGAACPNDVERWEPICSSGVIAGRLVNGYSTHDWVLSFLYRTASLQQSSKIAGLGPMPIHKVENVDLSDLIKRHTDYNVHLLSILKSLEIGDLAVVRRDRDRTLCLADTELVFDEKIKEQVLEIYREHNPQKSKEDLHKILTQYQGREEELLKKIRLKYVA